MSFTNHCRGVLTPTQLSNLIHDLAEFHITLSTLPFPLSGSLHPPDRSVGQLCRVAFSRSEAPFFFGPFKSEKNHLLAKIDDQMEGVFSRLR